jgi:uncharacterized protein (TIGR02271 family)
MMASDEDRNAGSEPLPVAEEHAEVNKRQILDGRVRVQTITDTVEEVVEAELEKSSVEITRVPIGKTVTEPPPVRTEGDVTIVPVVEEMLKIERRLVLKEEVHIRHRRFTETVSIPVSLQKQHPVVEREHFDKEDHEECDDASRK